jgi:hypothetical protein
MSFDNTFWLRGYFYWGYLLGLLTKAHHLITSVFLSDLYVHINVFEVVDCLPNENCLPKKS